MEVAVTSKTRVIIARLGLDAHWRGSVVVARAIRDAGMEVIYLGNQMPDAVVKAAVDEDPDVVGLSSLSGNHMILVPMVTEGLRRNGMEGTPVILGGTIPENDVPFLKENGVAGIFGPGSSLKEIIDFITCCVNGSAGAGRRAGESSVKTACSREEGNVR
jgi:methylmalonyl-CoA mutase, C-terminal domain